ncbi:MAG: response regulator [Planctomycetota bacterium]|jgi:PAS domain S-box-containing protein
MDTSAAQGPTGDGGPGATTASPDFYRNLLDAINDLVWSLSLDGRRMLYLNEAAQAVYGGALEELRQRDNFWLGALHPDDKQAILSQLTHLSERGSFSHDFRVLDRAGKERWLSGQFRLIRSPEGRPLQIGVIAKDVTLRLRTQAQLVESQAIYESLVQSLPLNVFRKDREGRVVFGNQRYCETLGRTLAELIGKTDRELFDPKLAEKYQSDDRRVMSSGRSLRDIEEHPAADGTVRYVEVLKAPIFNPEGKPVGIQGLFWDVTERFLSEQQLKAAKELAEKASRAKSDFLANVSHEIRTPMNAIMGISELLLDSVRDRQHREYLGMILQSSESLLSLLNDLLDFSKIEAGKLELDLSAFNLRESLSDTLRTLAVRAQSKGLELILDFEPRLPEIVVADVGRLRQVLINLVANSIKFTRVGEVSVRFSIAASDEQAVVVQVEVQDSGIGIPPDKLATVFREFEQSDRSTSREYGGTGLGLPIAARLVELMGGKLEVESTVGKGSRFHFQLRCPTGGMAAATEPEPALGTGPEVMVVEDHQPTAASLGRMLGGWGYRVLNLESGRQAVKELEKRRRGGGLPQALVIDYTLPDGHGWDLIEAIRRHHEYDSVGLVLLTSGQSLASVGQGLDFEQVMKPIKPRDLLEALSDAPGGGAAAGLNAGNSAGGSARAVNAESSPPEQRRALRILVAEDNLVNQKLALGLLERQGHIVSLVENGAEAVRLAATGNFDLVLMDVQMPVLGGVEATRQIRAGHSPQAQVPIIALTAHATDEVRRECLAAGMTDFLPKPIRREQLYRLIDALTGRSHGEPADSALPSAGSGGAIDWRHALETVGGDQELLAELIQVFLTEREVLWRLLEEALRQGDGRAFRRGAHSFRGSLLHLGATEARALAEQLELLGQAGDLERASEKLGFFRDAMQRLSEELESFLQRTN